MKLEEYAAQQAQDAQQAPQAQEALTVGQLAAKLDAEKLLSLMDQLQTAIDEQAAPAAMLEALTGALFGSSSPQAAAVAKIIDADRHPGGHEMAIAAIRQRRRLLKQQARQLEEQLKATADALDQLDAAEQALKREKEDAAALDAALLETLTFCRAGDPQQDIAKAARELYEKHQGHPAAMGLLYGSISEKIRQQYSAGGLDLLQLEELDALKARIAASITA